MANRLAGEKSPYLLQHKDNPVQWFPWGLEAFEKAKREDKPIFLSIGYSTCYWCHVMEKDSFETEEVASVLNRAFVPIKLDREERPDVDQVYMDAIVGLTGHGGWPMSIFLTPELKPFWGGTFFPKEKFISVLESLSTAWTKDKEKIFESADEITRFLKERSLGSEGGEIDDSVFVRALDSFAENFDEGKGGFGGAPKFPPCVQTSLLLRIYRRSSDERALRFSGETLLHMASGGIFDHIGGGFHRYSTDRDWLVPHFEKMLYDNALCAISYLEAFQETKEPCFAEVAAKTLRYVLRDMTGSEGGFFSAEDAGEVGKEGEYYVWSLEEIRSLLLPAEFDHLSNIYEISTSGNFEGANILALKSSSYWKHRESELINSAHQKLFAARGKRPRPRCDDKVLTAWNGLMIGALAKGYQVLGDLEFLGAAERCAEFLQSTLFKGGKLMRRFREGEVAVEGFHEDYAYLIEGLIGLYETGFNERWLLWARELQTIQDQMFWDEAEGGYFYSASKEVIVRKKELMDGATPAPNAVSFLNLLRLYGFFGNAELLEKYERLSKIYSGLVLRYPTAFSKALHAFDYILGGSKEVAVVSGKEPKELQEFLVALNGEFNPNKVLAVRGGDKAETKIPLLHNRTSLNGKLTIYVCENHSCKLPLTDTVAARELIQI